MKENVNIDASKIYIFVKREKEDMFALNLIFSTYVSVGLCCGRGFSIRALLVLPYHPLLSFKLE